MKLVFDHTKGFGKMRDQVIFYAPYGALFQPSEYNEALNTGWFPTETSNTGLWFQCRSTRLLLELYEPSKTTLKLSKNVKFFPDVNMTDAKMERLKQIYASYVNYKKFKSQSYYVEDMVKNSHGHIYYTYNGKIIAFLFFKTIGTNFLAVEFAWDYADPKLSLGNVSIYCASQLAKFKKCKYIYMSAGYESCSAYKANYKGFEWWTGYSWSCDVDLYKQLCYDDDLVALNNYKYA